MYRRILILICLTGLVGCTSSGLRMSAEEWFNMESQRWVDAVVRSCEATHQNHADGKSLVDCASSHPEQLRMSFPSREFFVQNEQGIGEYLSAWCVAVANRYGQKDVLVEIYLREDEGAPAGATHKRSCQHILNRTRRTP